MSSIVLTVAAILYILVQAERVPAEPAPTEPDTAESDTTKPAPAEAVPDPASAGPAAGEPPALAEANQPPNNVVGVAAGLAYRLASPGEEVPPALGFSITTMLGHRYALLGNRVALGVAGSFAYERYARTVPVSKEISPGQSVPYDGVRGISLFDFAALHTVTLELGRARPWLAAGGGISLGHFTTPEPKYQPGESRATVAVLAGGAGVDVSIAPGTDVGLRLEYAHPLPKPTFETDAGGKLRVFGNRIAARLGLQYRF